MGEILPQEITEDIIRVFAIAKGGFYINRSTQQKFFNRIILKTPMVMDYSLKTSHSMQCTSIFDYLKKY